MILDRKFLKPDTKVPFNEENTPISLIEDELQISISEAYFEMEDTINKLNAKSKSKIMNESGYSAPLYEYDVLNEGAKDAIKAFLKKSTEAIQKAWNAFKERRVKGEVRDLIAKNKDKLNSAFRMLMPKEFEIPKLETWDHYYTSIEIKDFGSNYQSWKQNKVLESPEDFIKSQYNDLVDGDKSIEDVLHEKIFYKAKDNQIMNKDTIKPYSDYLLEYGDQITAISKDLDTFNESIENIQSMLDKITESATEYIGDRMLSMIFEDGENNQQQSSNNNQQQNQNANPNGERKEGFQDADDPNGKKKEESRKMKEDKKNILVYFKGSTKVFSAKMKTCDKVKNASEKLVKNFIKLQMTKSDKKEEKSETVIVKDNNETTIKK